MCCSTAVPVSRSQDSLAQSDLSCLCESRVRHRADRLAGRLVANSPVWEAASRSSMSWTICCDVPFSHPHSLYLLSFRTPLSLLISLHHTLLPHTFTPPPPHCDSRSPIIRPHSPPSLLTATGSVTLSVRRGIPRVWGREAWSVVGGRWSVDG
jgi:hypothetical protein